MKHDPLCTHERHHMCICGELRTARVEERTKILLQEDEGHLYRMGKLDSILEIQRIANNIPQGSEYDPIWVALSAAIDAISGGVDLNDKSPSDSQLS